jgi:adenine-specific DNA-methyltransferase
MHADYVVVEVGEHFDSVLLPRVLKASAGTSWRRGQLAESAPYVATHKVVHLESYDDTLENVVLHRDASVGPPSSSNASLREDHNLRYVLDLESRGSLLALDGFARPWDYTIKIREHGVVQDSPVDLVETFNYLLGLRVQRYDSFGEEGLLFVTGEDPDGQRVVVIWRDCDAWPNDALELRCRQIFDARPADRFDVVYVNGDNHLPTIRAGGERCEVSPTEQAFHGLMFDTCDVE